MTNEPATKPAEHSQPAILLVDKPAGMTSHDVVSRVRRAAGTRKVGHAGTLDPMATGLLMLGVNSATRLLGYLLGLDKVYTATIRLGAASSTDDAEGELGPAATAEQLAAVTEEHIREGIARLSGDILQVPSSVSAIKVAGERAYALVRAGEVPELAARPVSIRSFDLVQMRASTEWIDLSVRVHCSSGTYIRALARDLGAGLGVGGHLVALRRESIGPFSVSAAASLETPLTGALAPAEVAGALFPTVTLDAQQRTDLAHGKKLYELPLPAEPVQPLAAIGADGTLLGLLHWDGRVAAPMVNFPLPSQKGVDAAPVTESAPEAARRPAAELTIKSAAESVTEFVTKEANP